MNNRYVAIGMAVLAALVFCSCNDPGTSRESNPTDAGVDRIGTSASPAPGITLRDAAGRRVDLPKPPQRIVAIGNGPYMILHLLYMFDETRNLLVGYEDRKKSSAFLPCLDPDISAKKVLQAHPGPEQVAALRPDLVIMKGTMEDQMGRSLSLLGIRTLYLGMETPELFLRDVDNVGIVLGNRERARKIRGFYTARLSRLEERLKGVPDNRRPRCLTVLYTSRGGKRAVQVPAASWMQTIQMQRAGGRPVWIDAVRMTDGWTVVNFEQVAAWNPDKIFVIFWHALDPKEVMASLRKDPQWGRLRAVRTGEIHAFPGDVFGWDSPEPRWILGLTWLASKIGGQRSGDLSLRDEVHAFFGTLYNMDERKIDAVIMPSLRAFTEDPHA